MEKIIFLGDSITAGYENGVTDFRLNEEIEAAFPNLETINAGIPGDTTEGALKRVEKHVIKYNPDLVTVFFGANDVSNVTGITLEAYKKNMYALVEKIGPEKIILIGPPYADQKQYEKERNINQIKAFNEVVQMISQEKEITYIDLLAEMLKSEPTNYLQSDGLHFSRAGYTLLGQLINEAIRQKKEG